MMHVYHSLHREYHPILLLTRIEPHAAGSLDSLEALNLTHNALTGPLPASLAAAPLLATLDASHNQMGGTLGQYAAALPARGGAATTLLLDHNNLSGGQSLGVYGVSPECHQGAMIATRAGAQRLGLVPAATAE